jgi:hypothetical protein
MPVQTTHHGCAYKIVDNAFGEASGAKVNLFMALGGAVCNFRAIANLFGGNAGVGEL